ncbi:MAG: pilin [Patescibacteria group bacterium]
MVKILQISASVAVVSLFFSLSFFIAGAADAPPEGTLPIVDVSFPGAPVATDNISSYIVSLYKFGVGIAGILAVGMIVTGAILYSISGAVDKKNEGKDMIYSAIWGVVLLLGSYLILKTVNPRLVELSPPGGNLGKIESPASCKERDDNGNRTDLSPCGPNQSPLTTSTDPISGQTIQTCQCFNKSAGCPAEVFDDCQPQRVEVRETVEELFPVCRPGVAIKEGEGCIWGWPASAGGPPRSRWEKETFQAGDIYWQYPYYPRLAGPTNNNALCVPYAHQRKDKDKPEREGDFNGLKPC